MSSFDASPSYSGGTNALQTWPSNNEVHAIAKGCEFERALGRLDPDAAERVRDYLRRRFAEEAGDG